MDPLDPLRTAPATTALFVDFDGTLSEIVVAAADARPLPGVPALLTELRHAYGRVAVVSGRPVEFLQQHLSPAVELHGLYGLQAVVDGVRTDLPGAAAWRGVIDAVVAAAVGPGGPAGVDVEHKGLSLTVHFRRHPEAEAAAMTWAEEAADRAGLDVRPAKMSVELHPPVTVDKGTVVERRAEGMTAVAYVGDDAGDLPAFGALDRLAAQGIAVVRVAVHTPDACEELLAAADVRVDGPAGAVALLRSLLPQG